MFLEDLKRFEEKRAKVEVHVVVVAANDVKIILCKLERCCFEAQVARTGCKTKTEVNVNEMTERVDKYVGVMAVFDLKQVAKDGVAGKALNKVLLSFVKVMIEDEFEDGKQTLVIVELFESGDGVGVGNVFDHCRTLAKQDKVEVHQEDANFLFDEDVT